MNAPILNGGLARRRRLELSLSERVVAKQLGVASSMISRLEAGTNHGDLPLGLVARYAHLLAVPLTALCAEPEPSAADGDGAGDAQTVGALLHHTGVLTAVTAIAEALEWTLARTRGAIDALAAAAPGAGQAVHESGGQVRLVAAATAVEPQQMAAVLRRHQASRSLSPSKRPCWRMPSPAGLTSGACRTPGPSRLPGCATPASSITATRRRSPTTSRSA